jgi:putative FmdB family regulatory protein
MPIYEYEGADPKTGCPHCRNGFEVFRKMTDVPLAACPQCGGPVRRRISAASVGASRSGFNDRAKAAGFHRLERRDKGAYEKVF